MAFRLPNENLQLTVAEKAEAVREFMGAKVDWEALTQGQQTQFTLAYLRQHPELHPDHETAVESDVKKDDGRSPLPAEPPIEQKSVPRVQKSTRERPQPFEPKLLRPIGESLTLDERKAFEDEIEAITASEKSSLVHELESERSEYEDLGLNTNEVYLSCQIELALGVANLNARKAFHAGMIVMRAHVEKELAPLLKRFADLETKCDRLETRASRHAEHLKKLENWKQGQR